MDHRNCCQFSSTDDYRQSHWALSSVYNTIGVTQRVARVHLRQLRLVSPTDNKKLRRCRDSATCEPLDVATIAAKVQNSTAFHTPMIVLSGIRDYRYYHQGRLYIADSLDINLSCGLIFTFVVLCDNPAMLQTDGRTDGRTDVMLVA